MNIKQRLIPVCIVIGLGLPSATNAAPPALQTYKNPEFAFSIMYPANMLVITSPEQLDDAVFHNQIVQSELTPVVRFELPENPSTSNIAAALEIDIGTSPTAIASCLAISDPNEQMSEVSHIGLFPIKEPAGNGQNIRFLTYNYSTAAAGSRNSVTSYAALASQNDKQLCYQINIIQTGNADDESADASDATSVKEPKKHKPSHSPHEVFTRFTPMVQGFRFAQ